MIPKLPMRNRLSPRGAFELSMRTIRQDLAMKKPNSSMQLTRAADYGVRVMIQLASLSADGRVSLPALARATAAPQSFLSKVLQSLARAGLITSQRGQSGGFHITPRGAAASMREVIEVIDGTICLNVCLSPGRSCIRKPRCPAHPVWALAQRAMMEVLSSVSIASLAAPSAPTASRTAQVPSKPAAR